MTIEGSADDQYNINIPHCTICGFEFDGPGLERIYCHPFLPVPVCAICFDSLDHLDEPDDEESDYCIWCGDGGDLLLCDTCPSCVCECCVRNQLGEDILVHIQRSEKWSCFCCDSTPLECFLAHLNLQSDEDVFPRDLESTISLLSCVEDEILQCQHLCDDSIAQDRVIEEIRKECVRDGKDRHRCEVEISEWKNRWERHWQRMAHRSAELQEHVDVLGGDLALFYQQRDNKPRIWSEEYDLNRFTEPNSPPESPTKDSPHQATYIEYLSRTDEYQNPPNVQFSSRICVQQDYESDDASDFSVLGNHSITDSVVLKYSERPDPPPHSFPSIFLQDVPYSVLKALYYVGGFHPDRRYLIETFAIPPAIQTVLSYARYESTFDGFDQSYWPSLNLHPSIRKALYLGSSYEVSTLAGQYGVPPDVDQIEEIENPDPSDQTDSRTLRSLADLVALEDRTRHLEFGACCRIPPALKSRGDDDDIREEKISYINQKRELRSAPRSGSKRRRITSSSTTKSQGTIYITDLDDSLPRVISSAKGHGTNDQPILLIDSDDETPEIRDGTKCRSILIEDNFLVNSVEESLQTGCQIFMNRKLSDLLLPHQKEAVNFLWKNTMEGVLDWSRGIDETAVTCPTGSGCILAHCMGSGKTLSTLSFLATLLTNSTIAAIKEKASVHSLIHRILIICPVNVLANWGVEFQRWIPQDFMINHYTVDANLKKSKRIEILQSWYHRGGVCIIGKELYCTVIEDAKRESFSSATSPSPVLSYLLSPGPDIVVIDEAHTVRNSSSRLYNILKEIRTRRRVSLTGSPVQNNLRELWNMVEFTKPGHLFKWDKFHSLFIRPIEEGGMKDADHYQITQMKKKSYKLNSLLSNIMLRRGIDELVTELTPKREFVISLHLTRFQKFLYQLCMETIINEKGRYLFKACKRGCRIWNHPACLPLNIRTEFSQSLSPSATLEKSSNQSNSATSGVSLPNPNTLVIDEDICGFDEEEDVAPDIDSWWKNFPNPKENIQFTEGEVLRLGNKVLMFLLLLVNSVGSGDKVLLFTQSLTTLDFLCAILSLDWGSMLEDSCSLDLGHKITWKHWNAGDQFLRLDGSVPGIKRQELISRFTSTPSCKLLLISTMAGNMGINLQAANRVIIFDASWNPANDLQAVFRSYRYGQSKQVFVYRLLAAGTVEERMYKRQVTKLNVAARVVDAQMPENAYTYQEIETNPNFLAYESDLNEIAYIDAKREKMAQLISLDIVLLRSYRSLSSQVKFIEDMDSLTMDIVEEHLDETEKVQAEMEFQKEILPPLPDN